MLQKRKAEKIPYVRKLIKDLRKKIFDEKFTLFKDNQDKDQADVKDELENLFGNF